MARVLLTWELGFGIGHLVTLRGIGGELVRRGHQVIAAVRLPSKAEPIFAGLGIDCRRIPVAVSARLPFEPCLGYAHILGNIGFINESALREIFQRWNGIFDEIQPDLVITDHSPSVLFSLWGRPIPRVNAGFAFGCPPDGFPLPIWPDIAAREAQTQQLIDDENRVLSVANKVLSVHGRPRLAQLSHMFNQIDDVVLATYRELDHFGARPGAKYWGHWPFGVGAPPLWPAGKGPKVFSYISQSPNLEFVLRILGTSGWPTLVFASKIKPEIIAKHQYPTIRYQYQPFELQAVGKECDLAITDAGHGTVSTLLLAGKPCFLMPQTYEQFLVARAAEHMGAARMVHAIEEPEMKRVLGDVTLRSQFRDGAQAFVRRYAGWTPGGQLVELIDYLEPLLK